MARRKLHDQYFQLAKEEGYLARSAYKLKEIQKRRKILKTGNRVLDLGCVPGSWLQVASELVGPKGVIVGIDLLPVNAQMPDQVRTIVADATKYSAEQWLELAGPAHPKRGPGFDVVLSDMAPNTSGATGVDSARSVELCRTVLEIAQIALRPGGNLVMKAFEGEYYPDLLRETTRLFDQVKGLRPRATREVSREMFIIATRFRGPPKPKVPAKGAESAERTETKEPDTTKPDANWPDAKRPDANRNAP